MLRGELAYLGPGELGKRVDSPWREETRVVGGEVEVRRPGREPRRFALAQVPELDTFLRGFAALLGGEAAALAADFELAASGSPAGWRLRLVPRDRRLARRVAEIEVTGSGTTPRCFLSREADGDLGILMVEDLAALELPPRPPRSELEAKCRAGG